MNRANPGDMRQAMEMARALMDAGILFVPMPVADEAERACRLAEAETRLEQMAQDAEREESQSQGGAS